MRTRIIMGVGFAVGAVVLIVVGGPWYFGALLILGVIGLNEFYRLTLRYRPVVLAGLLSLAAVLVAAWYGSPTTLAAALSLSVLLSFALATVGGLKPDITIRIALSVLGVVYLGLGFGALLLMRRLDHGSAFVLTVVFGTWASDTVAYFTGRFYGQTPMTPVLSPKKTWEGFAGGVIGTLLLVQLIGLYTVLTPLQSLYLGLVIALVAPVGDLFESLIKRDAAIKDAGQLFPGHGGVLDRFDAMLFTSVASYVLLVSVFHY